MPSPPQRRFWQLGIVLVWLVAVGLLVQRELGGPRAASLGPTDRLSEATESRLGLFLETEAGRQRVGTVEVAQQPTVETFEGSAGAQRVEGIDLGLTVEMSLPVFGRTTDFELAGNIFRPYAAALATFDFRVLSGESNFRLEGQLEGDELSARVHSADEVLPIETTVDGDLVFSSGFGTPLSLPRLDVGEEVTIETFDPLSMAATESTVRCTSRQTLEIAGETFDTRRLVVDASGMKTLAWVDESGDVVRAETALGLILERLPAEDDGTLDGDAAANGAAVGAELLELTAIVPTGATPQRGARSMTLRIGGDLPQGDLPTDTTQTRVEPRVYRVLQGGQGVSTPDASVLASAKSADAFVQSDHPTIVAQAEEILSGTGSDPRAQVDRLSEWVFEALDKEAVLSVPSALEVLEMRKGDCNEHTVLYTALARAAGLPTRIAIGVVWSELLNGFYYHAWPEVWLGDRWLWVDPTFGQLEADATHIKLFNGGIQTWTQLLPYLGQLEIEVVDLETST